MTTRKGVVALALSVVFVTTAVMITAGSSRVLVDAIRADKQKAQDRRADEFSRRLPEEIRVFYLLAYRSPSLAEEIALPSVWPWRNSGEAPRGRWFASKAGRVFIIAGFLREGEFRPAFEVWVPTSGFVCIVEPEGPETVITVWGTDKERLLLGQRPFEAGSSKTPPYFYRFTIRALSEAWMAELSNLASLYWAPHRGRPCFAPPNAVFSFLFCVSA